MHRLTFSGIFLRWSRPSPVQDSPVADLRRCEGACDLVVNAAWNHTAKFEARYEGYESPSVVAA